MIADDKPVLVYSTFPSIEAAEAAGKSLVEARLAACVNIVPGLVSIYLWEGRLQRDSEVALLIKTREALAGRVCAVVAEGHEYDNPAVIVLPITGGSASFIDWICRETRDLGVLGVRTGEADAREGE